MLWDYVLQNAGKRVELQIEQNKTETKHKNPVMNHTGKISDLIKLDSNWNISNEKPLQIQC